MRIRITAVVLALGAATSVAHAQQVTVVSRAQPVRVISSLASNGIGYSVAHQPPGDLTGAYRIKVVCTVGQVSAIAHCPTARHEAHCPAALIVCR